ncbi:hypothetical protein MA16_Dca024577 [Dendrobium catenatum]|uniref:RRM domain-containing protein n=1 Tax=Dendrobium catenatum TaxID=906689 RepID=A0A2I0WWS5_9ASPA|nr:hypothetical protein MA16_Dca024577 [Dendrobium catenatum]
MLKVIWETSAGDYSAAKLREIFERFGIVEDVVIRTNSVKKKASAIIVMASKGATVRAIQSMSGGTTNPLLVLPLEPIAPSFSSSSSTNQNESMGPEFNNVVGAGFQNYEEILYHDSPLPGKAYVNVFMSDVPVKNCLSSVAQ